MTVADVIYLAGRQLPRNQNRSQRWLGSLDLQEWRCPLPLGSKDVQEFRASSAGGSLRWAYWYSLHRLHCATMSVPYVLAHIRPVQNIPGLPKAWFCSKVASVYANQHLGRMNLRMIILGPLNRTPFSAVSSSLYAQYSPTNSGTSFFISGQPDRMVDFSLCRAVSCIVRCCICLLSVTFRKSVWLMLSSSSSNAVYLLTLSLVCWLTLKIWSAGVPYFEEPACVWTVSTLRVLFHFVSRELSMFF